MRSSCRDLEPERSRGSIINISWYSDRVGPDNNVSLSRDCTCSGSAAGVIHSKLNIKDGKDGRWGRGAMQHDGIHSDFLP